MKLVVVAGFLGTGKTTVLLELSKVLHVQTGGKIAIIENEVGTVGIDDHMLREGQLPVREIYSGCICCSLRLGLIETLLALEREEDPTVVLLEPSGVASPRQVLGALQGYGGEIEQIFVLTLIDASRFIRFQTLDLPIITDGIKAADMLVLNKTDLVSEEQLIELEGRLRVVRADVPMFRICALEPETLKPVQKAIATCVAVKKTLPAEIEDDKVGGLSPVVATRHLTIQFTVAEPADRLKADVLRLLAEVSRELQQTGCQLIGHIKAIIRAKPSGYWFGSVTEFDSPVQAKGQLPRGVESGKFILNAIVFGVEPVVLERILDVAIHKQSWNEI